MANQVKRSKIANCLNYGGYAGRLRRLCRKKKPGIGRYPMGPTINCVLFNTILILPFLLKYFPVTLSPSLGLGCQGSSNLNGIPENYKGIFEVFDISVCKQ